MAWAPGKGCKELKEHWNIDKGATFVPHKTFEKLKISALEDGGEIVGTTLPDGFRIEGLSPDRRVQSLSSASSSVCRGLFALSKVSVECCLPSVWSFKFVNLGAFNEGLVHIDHVIVHSLPNFN